MTPSLGAARRALAPALLGLLISGAHAAAVPSRAAAAERPAVSSTITFEKASEYYQEANWPLASAAFEAIVKREPANARAWHRLGVCRQKLARYAPAIEAYRRAESIGHSPLTMYNLAAAFGLAGNADSAFAWLDRAADAGYRQPDALLADDDFASLRADARFAAAVERVRRATTPCAFSPEARQFDFWVGSWDVRTERGDLAGTNDIRLGAGECVLVENWKGAQGGLGQSLNFYDPDAKLWRQIWVDASQAVTRFEGTFTEGQMRFRGDRVDPAGRHVPVKMTFTPLPDGRVRQTGEVSNDGGATWSVEYDLYYSKARRDG